MVIVNILGRSTYYLILLFKILNSFDQPHNFILISSQCLSFIHCLIPICFMCHSIPRLCVCILDVFYLYLHFSSHLQSFPMLIIDLGSYPNLFHVPQLISCSLYIEGIQKSFISSDNESSMNNFCFPL